MQRRRADRWCGRWVSAVALTGVLMGWLAAGAWAGASGRTVQLSIVTGGTGGVYYVLGGGLASLLSRRLPGVNAVAEVTSASVDNILLVADKEAEIAFSLSDTAYLAAQGMGPFEQTGPVPIRVLTMIYQNYNHLVARAGSGIQSVPDLRGKRVSTGAPGSGTEVTALRILRAYGLDPDRDVRRDFLGVAESADALRDGRIDAFFWSGGYPTGAVMDLASTPGFDVYVVPMGEIVPKLVEEYGPFYAVATFPAGAYNGDVREATTTVGVPNVLLVHADMDEQLTYEIVKAIFEYKDELVAIHPSAAEITVQDGPTSQIAPYHPGAIRYFQQQGTWGR
ncbi:TAXI family TRAP transporter solute-binding subunit [Geochorda subterranea]|uniref:TAXI family TRAP transporter solute-binding subunit n=1 Tax=Geochorda subterranea TaxID=3109564 RepID=A0ABZ1BQX3_9FIRM|nr:TAXI family TRAP transporter solute-binding subunit [Limnochorda sp. LNt]WRP15221.1 TAXI family TRAP transporter solute-binding subunit [Limnochorda sp. LNt]